MAYPYGRTNEGTKARRGEAWTKKDKMDKDIKSLMLKEKE